MQAFLDIFDIYLLEAVINGILLGGVLALLALGLNLIFGVIDVTWICYAELVMIGMYAMYFLVQYYGISYFLAAPLTILLVALLGAALHYLVIAPLLMAPPINQLLATGGVLFVLQSFATVAFGIDFRNLGIRLPVLAFGDMNFSYARLLSFLAALVGIGRGLSVHDADFHRHRDPGDLAGPADHGADGRRYQAHLSHHLGNRRGAGRARRLPVGSAI
ncbi:branched-subunit amino acid ABC-type transport system permease component [Bradyrhizobium sp. F1.13.1]